MNDLVIAGTSIRKDAEGRYCLNDLHRAAGGEKRHQPSNWLHLQQTKDLIGELTAPGITGAKRIQPVSVVIGGSEQGTYVAKELVYSYAMWISPAFHLKVIRAYDAMVTAPQQALDVNDPASLRAFSAQLLLDKADLIERIREVQPKADAFERLAKAEGLVTFTDAAKLTGVSRGDLIELAFSLSWVYRDRATGDIYPYAAVTDVRMDAPLMTLRTLNVGTAEKPKMKKWAYLTARGLARLAELVKRERSALVAMPH
jgi:phage antirepressor YoqD-like protein